jgi:hypothetical protein
MRQTTTWLMLMIAATHLAACGDDTGSAATADEGAAGEESAAPSESAAGDLEAWCASWATPLIAEGSDDPQERAAAFEQFARAAQVKYEQEAAVAPPEIAGYYDVVAGLRELEIWEQLGWDPEAVTPEELEDAFGPAPHPNGENPSDVIDQFGRDNCYLDR